jgi:hypothetical protein
VSAPFRTSPAQAPSAVRIVTDLLYMSRGQFRPDSLLFHSLYPCQDRSSMRSITICTRRVRHERSTRTIEYCMSSVPCEDVSAPLMDVICAHTICAYECVHTLTGTSSLSSWAHNGDFDPLSPLRCHGSANNGASGIARLPSTQIRVYIQQFNAHTNTKNFGVTGCVLQWRQVLSGKCT